MSTRFELPYPPMSEDTQAEMEAQRYERARDSLDPIDVLSEVQSLLLGIADDAEHPLYSLILHCTQVGTYTETGKRASCAATVGEALMPIVQRAIDRLVQERLEQEE